MIPQKVRMGISTRYKESHSGLYCWRILVEVIVCSIAVGESKGLDPLDDKLRPNTR